jgi:hypothetical protein
MTIFDPKEEIEFLAVQSLHYDRYAGCQYFLECLDAGGRCGLVCRTQSEEYGMHARVILPPLYDEVRVTKISSHKALYSKYAVFGDGDQIGQFTLVLNAWVPREP